jgi:hypothetical protein
VNSLKDEKSDLLTQITSLSEELELSKKRLLTNNTEQSIPPTEGEEKPSTTSHAASNVSESKSNDSGVGLSDSLQNGPRLSDTEGSPTEDERNGPEINQVCKGLVGEMRILK